MAGAGEDAILVTRCSLNRVPQQKAVLLFAMRHVWLGVLVGCGSAKGNAPPVHAMIDVPAAAPGTLRWVHFMWEKRNAHCNETGIR
ncbi:MAG: hypothetical protein ACRENC_19065 [Gemmatimonadaceae bacterium]